MYLVAVFPSGRVASAWMRWPLALAVVISGFRVVARMVLPIPVATETNAGLVNPWAIEAPAVLLAVEELLGAGMTALLVVAMLDLALRWRRSTGVERLQMRWLALLLFALLLLTTGLLRLADLPHVVIDIADTVAWLSGLSLLPVAIGVAVTRYRLFEIDRLISRTVTYGLVMAALVAVFMTGVLVLRSLLPPQSQLGVAASTLAVTALFNPLRRRAQRIVERRFNRSRYDAERELERFAGRLRDELDLDGVTRDLLGVVVTTVQPSRAGLWIGRPAP